MSLGSGLAHFLDFKLFSDGSQELELDKVRYEKFHEFW